MNERFVAVSTVTGCRICDRFSKPRCDFSVTRGWQQRKVFRIGTVGYHWPMSVHASQAFSIASCTDSEDLPQQMMNAIRWIWCTGNGTVNIIEFNLGYTRLVPIWVTWYTVLLFNQPLRPFGLIWIIISSVTFLEKGVARYLTEVFQLLTFYFFVLVNSF